jgi:hypothetical protein
MIKIDESLITGMVLISLMLGLTLLSAAVRILDYSLSDHAQVLLLTNW